MKRAISRKNAWESLPGSLRTSLGWVFGRMPSRWLLGSEFRRNLAFVEGAQWWPAERIREHQLSQLRDICSLAYEKTTYYRRAFDSAGVCPADIQTLEDLRAIRTTDKSVLHEHLAELCTEQSAERSVDYVSTGGSDGAPLRFYIGAGRSAIEYAYLVAGWARAGYHLGVSQAELRGTIVPPDDRGLRHQYDPILKRHSYSNFHTTDEDLKNYVEHIAGIGPCFLLFYPSSAAILARYLERSGIQTPPTIQGVLLGSEVVYPEDRAVVERVFNVRCFSWYGHTEKLAMAAECEHSTNYHVWPTYGYVELLDDDGKSVTVPGVPGEIVATGFINKVVPFIRYRTGDYATFVADRCASCGRNHLIIKDIQGHRSHEALIAMDGTLIPWTALNMHDDTFERVRRFQFYQDTPGRATLRIVPDCGYCERDGERIRRNLSAKLDGGVELDLETVKALPMTPRGKALYVDQRIGASQHERRMPPSAARQTSAEKGLDSCSSGASQLGVFPEPPDLSGTVIVKPISVLRIESVKPAEHIVYQDRVRKALTFLLQEGVRWTCAKIRCKIFYRRIVSRTTLIIVIGMLRDRAQLCVACGQQFSPELVSMLFRAELVFPVESPDAATVLAKKIACGLNDDPAVAQRLADFSHYSSEAVPRVPGLGGRISFRWPDGTTQPPSVKWARTSESLESVEHRRRLFLVGAGDYAFAFVLPHLRGHCFDTVVDFNPLIAKAVAKRFRFDHMETDYRRIVRRVASMRDVTVIVASYHSQHTEIALAFLEANPKACVMIEKPPTLGYEQLARLLPHVANRDEFIEIGFNRRYAAMVKRAVRELSGRTDRIVMTCIIREDNMEPSHWYYWESEGTRIYGNLCHWIDLGVHVIGRRPVEIVGQAGDDFEVAATVSVRFEDGSLLTLVSGSVGSAHRGVQELIDIRSGDLTMQIQDFRRMVIQRGGRQWIMRNRTRDKGHREMYRVLATNVRDSRCARYTSEDLLLTGVLTEEIRQMMEVGERQRAVDAHAWLREQGLHLAVDSGQAKE